MRRRAQGGVGPLAFVLAIVVAAVVAAGYFWLVLSWNYSTGERAGWVQKFSKKGWLCKTWEGELALENLPGATQEKFLFSVRDEAVAESVNKFMGKRVSLHYEEKVGLPTSCFGDTRHFVTSVKAVDEIPLAPGVMIPAPAQPPVAAPAPPPLAAPPAGAKNQ